MGGVRVWSNHPRHRTDQRCIEAAEKVGAAPVGCIEGAGATPLVDMRKN